MEEDYPEMRADVALDHFLAAAPKIREFLDNTGQLSNVRDMLTKIQDVAETVTGKEKALLYEVMADLVPSFINCGQLLYHMAKIITDNGYEVSSSGPEFTQQEGETNDSSE